MSFHCILCDAMHDEHARAVEHVIPERLGNKNFTHPNVCARVNGGLAHAVEAPFHERSTINEILVAMDPPRGSKPRFLGHQETLRGTTETRYVYRGQFVLCDAPSYTRVDKIAVTLHRRNGTEIEYELKLPFPLLQRARGSVLLVDREDCNIQLELNKREVADYARRLQRNPSLDPDFARFVEENDVVLREPVVEAAMAEAITPNAPVSDLAPKAYVVDMEVACRYFAKIALLVAAQSPRPAIVQDPLAKQLRCFLVSFFVEPSLASGPDGSTLPLFRDVRVGGDRIFWWAAPVDQTVVALNTIPTLEPDAHAKLLLENAARVHAVHSVQHLFHFEACGSIDGAFHDSPRAFGFHELDFLGESDGLWCRIRLFGGLFSVRVHLSEQNVPELVQFRKRIDTPWFVAPATADSD